MPEVTFAGDHLHATLFEMAAAYAFHIAENQPFIDGNKRTALGSALIFLKMNDIEISDEQQKLYEAMIAISKHQMTKSGLAELLRTLVSA